MIQHGLSVPDAEHHFEKATSQRVLIDDKLSQQWPRSPATLSVFITSSIRWISIQGRESRQCRCLKRTSQRWHLAAWSDSPNIWPHVLHAEVKPTWPTGASKDLPFFSSGERQWRMKKKKLMFLGLFMEVNNSILFEYSWRSPMWYYQSPMWDIVPESHVILTCCMSRQSPCRMQSWGPLADCGIMMKRCVNADSYNIWREKQKGVRSLVLTVIYLELLMQFSKNHRCPFSGKCGALFVTSHWRC